MWKNLKKASLAVAFSLMLVLITGCATYDKYDRKLVRDVDGNIYRLEHSIGNVYIVHKLETQKLTAQDFIILAKADSLFESQRN